MVPPDHRGSKSKHKVSYHSSKQQQNNLSRDRPWNIKRITIAAQKILRRCVNTNMFKNKNVERFSISLRYRLLRVKIISLLNHAKPLSLAMTQIMPF